VGDSLYVCTPKNIMIALEPATGKERWRFDPKVPDDAIPYTAACRGVVYYAVPGMAADQPCAARIIEGTLDARLIAVDARTGGSAPISAPTGRSMPNRDGQGPRRASSRSIRRRRWCAACW
jgi:quinoprotein glucose dehydrogenase